MSTVSRNTGRRRLIRIAFYLSAFALILAIGSVIFTLLLSSRIVDAAARRRLAVSYGGTKAWVTAITLREVNVRAVDAPDEMHLEASSVEVRLASLRPYYVLVPSAAIELRGPVDAIVETFRAIDSADAAMPLADRLPIDVQAGSLQWKGPFGENSALTFPSVQLSVRPSDEAAHFEAAEGTLRSSAWSLSPLAVVIDRDSSSSPDAGGPLRARAVARTRDAAGGVASIDLSKTREGEAVTLTAHRFSLEALHFEHMDRAIVDISSALVDGSASLHRSVEGPSRSEGMLSISRFSVAETRVGPITIAFGGAANLSWKASPDRRSGNAGTMVIDEGRIDIEISSGRAASARLAPRTVEVRGTVSVGATGRGPFGVDLRYALSPIPCSELAEQVGGAAGRFIAGSITGSVSAKGTIKGTIERNASARDSLHTTMDVTQNCAVDIKAKTFGFPF